MNTLSILTALFSRIPAAARAGHREVTRKIVVAAGDFHGAVAKVEADADLSPAGRAKSLAPALRSAAAQLRKFERQAAHAARQISAADARIRKAVIGERDPDDAERRAVLRQMPDGDRVQAILTDPSLRAAALRLPECSGVDPEIVERALTMAISEMAPNESAALETDRESAEILRLAVESFAAQLRSAPVVIARISGEPRSFANADEFLQFTSEGAPKPTPRDIAIEESEIDLREAV